VWRAISLVDFNYIWFKSIVDALRVITNLYAQLAPISFLKSQQWMYIKFNIVDENNMAC